MNRTRPLVVAILAFGILAGCAVVAGKARETVLRLEPAVPVPRNNAPAAQPALLVIVGAEGPASGRRYTYVDAAAPREIRYAATIFWEETPAAMVQTALVDGLGARLGRPVLPGQVGLGASQRLLATLDRFEERAGAGALATVVLHTELVDMKSHALLFAARYCEASPIVGATGSQRSTAFEASVGRIEDRLAADIARGAAGPVSGGC